MSQESQHNDPSNPVDDEIVDGGPDQGSEVRDDTPGGVDPKADPAEGFDPETAPTGP